MGEPGELSVTVAGAVAGERHTVRFDPQSWPARRAAPLARPRFLAIVSSAVLASYLARNPATTPDGFVLESPVAGGHSAPPRGPLRLDADGEPVYGPRDGIDVAKVAALGLPFWLAGGHAGAGALTAARGAGRPASRSAPRLRCAESRVSTPACAAGLSTRHWRGSWSCGTSRSPHPPVSRSRRSSCPARCPTDDVYTARARLCDLGYLRVPYRRPEGAVGYRCPPSPLTTYVRKGGAVEETAERRCLCNGLTATIGLGQRFDDGTAEPPLLTLGQDLGFLPDLVARAGLDFAAADVIAHLLGQARA